MIYFCIFIIFCEKGSVKTVCIIYSFNAILIKIPIPFAEKEKFILKFVWNLKKPWEAKTILIRKYKVWSLTLPDFKTYYKAMVIRIVWHWNRDRHINQWNRIENTEVNRLIYGQATFSQGAKTIQSGKDSLPSKLHWEGGHPHAGERVGPLPFNMLKS